MRVGTCAPSISPGAISPERRVLDRTPRRPFSLAHGSPAPVVRLVLGSGVVPPACHSGCGRFSSLRDQPVKML